MRKIIHIDMDAFFASIEQRDNADYRGKPLVVGSPNDRGVVAAASYEARKFGIRSAMSSKIAQRLCPHLIFTPARFDVYKGVSQQIRKIFFQYTEKVEPLSLDEAFLDVTHNYKAEQYAMEIAKQIKADIFRETHLTASAGVSFNKFLAKIASDYQKPDGLFIISPKKAEKFVEKLKIEDFFGIGKKTAEKLHSLNIHTGWDLKQKTEEELINLFGKQGKQYFLNARGIDYREVDPNRIRKSIGAENTFMYDTDLLQKIYLELEQICKEVIRRIKKNKFEGKTVTLKIKFSNFRVISRSKTLLKTVKEYSLLYKTTLELLHDVDISDKVRLIGVSIKSTISEESTDLKGKQLVIPFKEFQ